MLEPRMLVDQEDVPAPAVLRQFAALVLVVGVAVFAGTWYRHGTATAGAAVGLVVGLAFGLPGLVYPPAVRHIFVLALAVTKPMGHVLGIVLLGLVYYLMVTPVAVVFRILRRDAIALRPSRADSYWCRNRQAAQVRSYLRQYQPPIADRKSQERP